MSDHLHDQLADLAHAAGAASTALSDGAVRRVATRVRRRRAARQVGAGTVAACAVGTVAFGAAHVGGSSGPPAAPPGGSAPTAPVTFDPSASESPWVESPAPPALWQTYFGCGEPVDLTVQTRPDAGGLVLAADEDLSVTLGVAGDAKVSATVPGAGTFALVGPDGDVVGYLYPDEDAATTVDLVAAHGDTARLDDGVHLLGCDLTDIPDQVTAWPFVEATILSTTADDEGERSVVVVADPRTITVPGTPRASAALCPEFPAGLPTGEGDIEGPWSSTPADADGNVLSDPADWPAIMRDHPRQAVFEAGTGRVISTWDRTTCSDIPGFVAPEGDWPDGQVVVVDADTGEVVYDGQFRIPPD